MPPQSTVAVIGLDDPGRALAGALAAVGTVVALEAASAGELGASANTVVLSLPSAEVVAEVVEVLCPAAPGLLILDTSLVGPQDSRRIAARALELGSTYLDTRVLGHPEEVGAWTVLMGGPAAAVRAVEAILGPVATTVVHVGEVGSAAATCSGSSEH